MLLGSLYGFSIVVVLLAGMFRPVFLNMVIRLYNQDRVFLEPALRPIW